MKALIAAFALLSFVAASTVPFTVPAQAQSSQTGQPAAKTKTTKAKTTKTTKAKTTKTKKPTTTKKKKSTTTKKKTTTKKPTTSTNP